MWIKCKNCIPKEGIEIPAFTNLEKLNLWNMKSKSSILAVKELVDNVFTHGDAKYIILHINLEYGKCDRCKVDYLNNENVTCPKCKAFNFNISGL